MKFLAIFDMFLFYDWLFLHVCILQGNLYYFPLKFLAQFSATMLSLKPGLHKQQCRSNVRLCCQKRQQCRTSFALKFRPFDKVEHCFDNVASVDRALRVCQLSSAIALT